MSRYVVLDNETGAPGKVVNTAVSDAPMSNGWILEPSGLVQIGWLYTGEQFLAPRIYSIKNKQITANDAPLQLFAGNYYCQPGDTIRMQGDITDVNGDIVVGINIPTSLKLPLVKHVNGQPFANEIYLNVTLQNGVITASGTIESSGDWKILIDRTNEALARIGAEFQLASDNITFLA
jgi:hypothetical protein